QNGVVAGGRREWYRNQWPAPDPNAAETSGGLVESKRREVKEAADLVLGLEDVSEILPGWDGAVGSVHSVLP
ncbi:hypothetical protein U1Q18_010918, partial [Sarracenia purpurea var. burkii]